MIKPIRASQVQVGMMCYGATNSHWLGQLPVPVIGTYSGNALRVKAGSGSELLWWVGDRDPMVDVDEQSNEFGEVCL